jgi:beta-lactamase regulating signal transducer with metallopeptidase domain
MTIGFGLVNAGLAAGWSLVHFFWQGAVLALALCAALKIAEKNSSNLRYLLCCVTLAGMALCPVLTLSGIEFGASNRSSLETAHSTVPDADAGHYGERSQIENRSKQVIDWSDRHMTAILAIWSAGAFLAFARLFVSLASVKRLIASSVSPAPDQLRSLVNQLAARLKLSGSVRLVVSKQVTAPVVVGWRKPVVILPSSSLAGLSPQQEEAILAHELAHIRRRDYLVNVIQGVLEAMLFYHPAIWWVSRQIRREREHCCDDSVLGVSGSPVVYAKALTLLEEHRAMAKPELSLGAYGGDLSVRINRLFERNHRKPLGRTTSISLASLAVLTLGVLAMLSTSAANSVSAQAAEVEKQQISATASATNLHRQPDMSCTFYDPKDIAHPHPGVCSASADNSGVYYCRQTDGNRLRQIQISCEWKVQRLRDWEGQQHQSK